MKARKKHMIKGLINLFNTKYGLLIFLIGVFVVVSTASAIMFKSYLSADNGGYKTYYVRTNGGSATQCTGLANEAYSGSGTGQACSWNNPMVALPSSGIAKIAGGDTLNIGSGEYEFDINSGDIPSGPDSGHTTKIIGEGWETEDLSLRPQLWGSNKITYILSLKNSNNVEVKWLELTDHSDCALTYPTPPNPPEGFVDLLCSHIDPNGYAKNGIFGIDSSNVLLKGLDIHGFSSGGIYAGRLTNWTVEDVDIVGNAFGGWNFQIAGDYTSNNPGPFLFKNLRVEWNGCVETYPERGVGVCFSQGQGNYGDGIGTAQTGGDWTFEDSIISHNTQDGLDLVYHELGGTITLNRVKSEGNAGNQIKTTGNTTIINSEIIDNCYYFLNQSFTMPSYVSPQPSNPNYLATFTHCRGGNGGISISYTLIKDDVYDFTGQGLTEKLILTNNTIHGVYRALVYAGPRDLDHSYVNPHPVCVPTVQVLAKNNIFLGGEMGTGISLPEVLDQTWCDAIEYDFDNNINYKTRTKYFTNNATSTNNILNTNPLLVNAPWDQKSYATSTNDDIYNMRLQANSPAINKISGVRGTDYPVVDLLSNDRPEPDGTLADMGAYEYGSVGGPPIIDDIPDIHGYPGRDITLLATVSNIDANSTYEWNCLGSCPSSLDFTSANALENKVNVATAGEYIITLSVTNYNGTTITSVNLKIHKLGDIDGDGAVNTKDFGLLLNDWGHEPTDPMVNIDGLDGVGSADFGILLNTWGT